MCVSVCVTFVRFSCFIFPPMCRRVSFLASTSTAHIKVSVFKFGTRQNIAKRRNKKKPHPFFFMCTRKRDRHTQNTILMMLYIHNLIIVSEIFCFSDNFNKISFPEIFHMFLFFSALFILFFQ